jgi:hypothetical protein
MMTMMTRAVYGGPSGGTQQRWRGKGKDTEMRTRTDARYVHPREDSICKPTKHCCKREGAMAMKWGGELVQGARYAGMGFSQ